MPEPARPSPWPALLAVLIGALLAGTLLFVHHKAAVLAVVAAGAALLVAIQRSGAGRACSESAFAHPRLTALAVAAAACTLVAVLREDNFALLMLCTVALQTLAALGLHLQFGYVGVANFAGAAFVGVGAYAAAVLGGHVPAPLVLAAGAGLAALAGLLLALPLLRTRGHYAALVTIAFGLLFRTFLEVNDALGGPQGLKVPGFTAAGFAFNDAIVLDEETEWSFYVPYALLALALLGGACVLVRRLERSWIGLALDAVRVDETAASAFGVNAGAWKIAAFSAGNALCGLAGALAPPAFAFGDSLVLVSIVILGGVGNPLGLLPAAFLVVVLPEKLQGLQEYRFLLFSVLVILVLRLRPAGLLPRALRRWPGLS
jgi:ABC-type branched-subunit amino acid transport system permease subunit